jgi:hypothetical protein
MGVATAGCTPGFGVGGDAGRRADVARSIDRYIDPGGALTCTAPVTDYTNWTKSCGTERWAVKTAVDADTSQVNLVPVITTIAQLTALTAPSSLPNASRVAPTETTLFELRDVTLTEAKLETDSDYHMVISDGSRTMIAEIPYPAGCAQSSAFYCNLTHARSVADSLSLTGSFNTINRPVTLMGIGFFDYQHGQTGVAPNAIELHPVLAMCVGAGCDPRSP